MIEFVDSGLYFARDKNNFINPLLQVGSGSWSVEKSTGSSSLSSSLGWQKPGGSQEKQGQIVYRSEVIDRSEKKDY